MMVRWNRNYMKRAADHPEYSTVKHNGGRIMRWGWS